MDKCPGCGVILVVPHGHKPGCPHEGKDIDEISSIVRGTSTQGAQTCQVTIMRALEYQFEGSKEE